MYGVGPGGFRDATADADYKVSDHLPGPLQDTDRDEVLAKIAQAMREQMVREGDAVITQGEAGDKFYLVDKIEFV